MCYVQIQGLITHIEPYNLEKVKTIFTVEETTHREVSGKFEPTKETFHVAISTGLNHHKWYEEAKENKTVIVVSGELRLQITNEKPKIWIIGNENNVYFK